MAEYQKGNREMVFVKGEFQQCQWCLLGQFVPNNPELNIVECIRLGEK